MLCLTVIQHTPMLPRSLRPLLIAGVFATLVAIISGALVSATAAGSACPAWPFCTQGLTLPDSIAAWIALGHRALVVIAIGLALVLSVYALRLRGAERIVRLPLLIIPALLVAQLPLDRLMVQLQIFDLLGVAHLAIALLMLGCQAVALAALLLGGGLTAQQRLGGRAATQARQYAGLAWWVAGASLVLTLVGSAITPAVAGPRLASIGGLPSNSSSALLVAGLLMGALAWQTWSQRRDDHLILGVGGLALALLIIEGGLLLSAIPVVPVIVGALLWSATLTLAVIATRRPPPELDQRRGLNAESLTAGQPVAHRLRLSPLIADYLSLTKPKVISLLLVTTLAAMFITEQGSPSGWLIFWTMLGGYLAAGGAGAINCAFDSDIDINMGRTSRRPVPSGRISRQAAMRFGLALSALSALVLLLFTTPLAMLLSTLGIFYYAVFYTQWLKRSTWQNIVIGGGAGSLPPLVGWTAVTGTLSLPAIVLFAIIFYWTPPHFWALALVKEKDYARAGVPMLPVVAGVLETRYQILVYSLILVALSTLLTPLGAMGWIYLVAALVFGARFLYDAWMVYRYGEQAHIWSLYKYSLLYLALLFAAMVIDRAVL